jgi:hypothetical protein
MPFIGGSGAPGGSPVSAAYAARPQAVEVGNGADDISKPLNITNLSRVTMMVTQTSGEPGVFRLEVHLLGDAPTVDYPSVAIQQLSIPVRVSFPVAAREAVIRVFGGPAGGPHNFQTVLQASAGS